MSKLMNNTGMVVDIFNLQKEDVNADVIILGACRINRFLGQTLYAYPVAAHLIGGYWYLESIGASDTLKKQWLIHEAFESYSGVDLPSPLKAELPLYKEAENRALNVIAEALTIMPNSNYWINFAKENNIENLSSAYDRTEGSEDFQNFNYFDGTHVPYGTRIGVEIVDKVTNLTSLELDFGICYP